MTIHLSPYESPVRPSRLGPETSTVVVPPAAVAVAVAALTDDFSEPPEICKIGRRRGSA